MRKRVVSLVIAAGAAAVGVGYWATHRAGGNDVVRVSGTIEATTVDASFRLPGRVCSRSVSGGALVREGQVVALLEDEEARHEVGLRAAEVEAARAALAELEAGARPEEIAQVEAAVRAADARARALREGPRPQEIAAAHAAVRAAQAEAERLASEHKRSKALHEKQAVSQSRYDAARAAHLAAAERLAEARERLKLLEEGSRKEDVEQAEAALAQARAALDLARAGPRQERIAQARARLARAEAALSLARYHLDETRLRAPVSGVVLSEHVEPGEYVAPGTPVLTLADLDRVWLRAYVDETDLGRVKLAQLVRVTTDTFPGREYEGRVSFISSEAEFTPKNVQTHKERVKLVYRTRIDVPNPEHELKPGMPADAVILTEGSVK